MMRKLGDLSGVGKAALKDFELLGVGSAEDLTRRDRMKLYRALEKKTGVRQDPCVLDVFRCAIAKAKDPQLDIERRNWWWWSRERKAGRLA